MEETEKVIADDSPLYNSRVIDNYIKLIRNRYSYINIDELLSYAGMEPYQVEDQGHWFTQEQINLFHEKLQNMTGETKIAREAGRYAASPDALGAMRQYILGLMSPAQAYKTIKKVASNFTRSATYDSRSLGPNKVEITITPSEGAREESFQCENRIGFFEAIALIFNSELPKIEHPKCMFRGDKVCRYVITWKRSPSLSWKKARNIVALLSMGSFLFMPVESSWTLRALHFLTSFIVVLLMFYYEDYLERTEMGNAIENMRESTERLVDQINVNYNNSLMINEIGRALSKRMDIDTILSEVVTVLDNRFDFDRGLILLANSDKTELVFQRGFGYTDRQFDMLRKASFHLNNQDSRGAFIVSFKEQRPILIDSIDDIRATLSQRSLEFVERLEVKSFISCPIIYEKEPLGIIAVDNKRSKRRLTQSDVNLLMGVAPGIGISIHNAMLIEAKEQQFESILKALAASIDARDPLTAGHSEKVTEYAVGICYEMGLGREFCETVRVASLLHDYGKIGVEDSILKKSGRLTAEEYEEIKKHADRSRSILNEINFEGIYKDVPDIAGAHHERFDGSGYPFGLKGEDIPLGARIIAVADFFEAITSKRHYRDPMPIDVAFQQLYANVGSYFQKDTVDAMHSYYQKHHAKKV